MTHALIAALVLLRQQPTSPPTSTPSAATVLSATTPPSRDTVGYWQQRIRYAIEATLDEGRGVAHGRATLAYVNASPDTLRELYVHQYLNAFRPGSAWSAADEREGRDRFQRLTEPAYGYERFTAAPTVNGVAVTPEYPGAPDSTVARLPLPRPLAPGDSLVATFAWDARPSIVPRRQARRGRTFDFAQWYPKVAVYDRAGWEARALVPAGEFYGEFGEYDVTLLLRDDQVVGATGIPVEGDPGWRRVLRWGTVHPAARGYGIVSAAGRDSSAAPVPTGFKRVRFVARDVHHFAWSASPDYRYEGGAYVRPAGAEPRRFPTWDTVAINVLYKSGDEREWGRGQAVERTRRALRWLEHVYGRYAYPQMTNLHRIDPGGTEFPMMMMNGSASQGLILHEGGHVFTYGILANNEWRSGWMDEGLTEYQTQWAQGLTRLERGAGGGVPLDSLVRGDSALATLPRPAPAAARVAKGYATLAARPAAADRDALDQYRLDLLGRAEPIGTPGPEFNEFRIYNEMIYDRAAMMYGALRDAIGDDAFRAFLRGYYARWGLRHVDEAAMRAEAERASGRDLGWFFDQWVHRTGIVDYALGRVNVARAPGGGWVTRARVERRGDYAHPVPVGVRTGAGWTVARGDALARSQTVEVRTPDEPVDVQLDPYRTTEDWYRPNDYRRRLLHDTPPGGRPKYAIDWPLLDQSSADRRLVALAPLLTSSQPNGVLVGFRVRSNYQGLADRTERGVLFATREPLVPSATIPSAYQPRGSPVQWWTSGENPKLFWRARPVMGFGYGVWGLDGVAKVQLRKTWDASQFLYAPGVRASRTLAFTGTFPYRNDLSDPFRWSGNRVSELTGTYARRSTPRPAAPVFGVDASLGVGVLTGAPVGGDARRAYVRSELALTRTRRSTAARDAQFVRVYVAYAEDAPRERQVYASVADPTTTFANHFWRPRGGPLAPSVPAGLVGCCVDELRAYRTVADGHYLPLGGAALRGYDSRVVLGTVVAVNAEQARLLRAFGAAADGPKVYASLFADAGVPLLSHAAPDRELLADAGVGASLRGKVFDRDVRVRADFPLWVRASAPDVGGSYATSDTRGETRLRFAFSFNDLW